MLTLITVDFGEYRPVQSRQKFMSAAKQRDGASILGMVWVSRFVNHTQNKPPYKEGVSPHLVVW